MTQTQEVEYHISLHLTSFPPLVFIYTALAGPIYSYSVGSLYLV